MSTTEKIRNDIAKTKAKIAEQQKHLRELEQRAAEEENLEIVRMIKAVKMEHKELLRQFITVVLGFIFVLLFL